MSHSTISAVNLGVAECGITGSSGAMGGDDIPAAATGGVVDPPTEPTDRRASADRPRSNSAPVKKQHSNAATTDQPPQVASPRLASHVKLSAAQELSLASHDGLLSFDDKQTATAMSSSSSSRSPLPGHHERSSNPMRVTPRPYAAFDRAEVEGAMTVKECHLTGSRPVPVGRGASVHHQSEKGVDGGRTDKKDSDGWDAVRTGSGLDASEREAALERRRLAEDSSARRWLHDTTGGGVAAASELTETDLETYEGFDRIGGAVTDAVKSGWRTVVDAASAPLLVAAADRAFAPVDDFGAKLREVADAVPDRRDIEEALDRAQDTAVRMGFADYPLTTIAVFTLLALTALANVNLFNGGESPIGWRPGDMVPKRFRYRGGWKAEVGAEFGGEGGSRINVMKPSQFKTHDTLRSYMHPTELVQFGISTEGHELANRPLLEVNDKLIEKWTAPPPPPDDAEKYATERANLPKNFDKWDEHHKKIWLQSKRMHNEELRAAEVHKIVEKAEESEAALKKDEDHHKVLRDHAWNAAKDKISSMVQGAGFTNDVYLESTDQDLLGEQAPVITYTRRKPGQFAGKEVTVGKRRLLRHRRMMT